MNIKNKLNRLKPHIKKETGKQVHIKTETKAIPFLEMWEKENVHPYWTDDEYCLIREVKYPLSFKHGNYYFSEFFQAVDEWNHSPFIHPLSAKGHKADNLFFFDTETTGLGGGAGNTIFILGYAQIVGDEVVLKQHILPNPGGEVPLFKSFLENVDYTTLVTYNGKAFDWPQVKTRHMFVKEHVPRLPEFGHFDLYHASRRMWKHRLERTKLSIVEKEVLGVVRKDDIPGFLAPMIYFDFVERKHPEGMLGILKHNEIDILSLITLYTHLSYQLLKKDKNMSAKEQLEVGRWYSSLGESNAAKKTLENMDETNKEEALQAKFILAAQEKKAKKIETSIALWQHIIDHHTDKTNIKMVVETYIELAKVAEHQTKNYAKALQMTNKAIILCQKHSLVGKQITELLKRADRIQKKANKLEMQE